MIGKIVIGQRMDQGAQARLLDRRQDRATRGLEEMRLELRDRMRAGPALGQTPDKQDPGIVGETSRAAFAAAGRWSGAA